MNELILIFFIAVLASLTLVILSFFKNVNFKKLRVYSAVVFVVCLVGLFVTAGSAQQDTETTSTVSEVIESEEDSSDSGSYDFSTSSSSSSVAASNSSSSEEPFDPNAYEEVDFNAWNHDDIEMLKKIKITGKVLQVSQGSEYTLRVAVNDNYDQVVLVSIPKTKYDDVVAEDDHITVYGTNFGLTTYETVLGSEKTLPSLIAREYDVTY